MAYLRRGSGVLKSSAPNYFLPCLLLLTVQDTREDTSMLISSNHHCSTTVGELTSGPQQVIKCGEGVDGWSDLVSNLIGEKM